jgi:hypothetical protein
MALGGPIGRLMCLAGALVAALALAACGSSSQSKPPGEQPASGPGAPKGAPTPREAIIQFFEAKRTGNTELGCSLEAKDFQIAQYKGVGQACMNSEVNMKPQKVWAETIKITKLQQAHDSASATIFPTKGSDTPAEISLVRGEGGWLIYSLR